ncbi:hypothetical protein N9T93_00265 [Flavobacteriaceae bacterium]|nr:hypothetical protein [Flavobacteriaceae bacterium]
MNKYSSDGFSSEAFGKLLKEPIKSQKPPSLGVFFLQLYYQNIN